MYTTTIITEGTKKPIRAAILLSFLTEIENRNKQAMYHNYSDVNDKG